MINCLDKTYSYSKRAQSQSDCSSCNAGYACALGAQTICAAGSYSSSGQSACTTCPLGITSYFLYKGRFKNY
jgi:hypothetical protein